MKKIYKIVLLALAVSLLLVPTIVFAGGHDERCDTKCPIILAHGTGGSAEIFGVIEYWWGIPEALEDEGAKVYLTSVNGLDGTVDKAIEFETQFLQIKAISGALQFNIIGHSHGALYTRYAVSNLKLSPYVKSLTSIAGPHQGMVLADIILKIVPTPVKWIAGDTLDFVYDYIVGDTNSNSCQNAYDVTTTHMQKIFNPNTPDMDNVYYQSWAAEAKYACPNIILDPSWRVLKVCEGANDGLVSVNSAKWGNFRGVEDGAWWSPGCDHLTIIGQLFGVTPGFNAPDFYVDVVSDLKSRGY